MSSAPSSASSEPRVLPLSAGGALGCKNGDEQGTNAEEWGNWFCDILTENPQILSLRERVLPWTGGYSFANVVHAGTTTSPTHLNRYSTLELIYQHLNAIGMYGTAEMLEEETHQRFQLVQQPWDKTDLHVLASMGVSARENAWDYANEPNHKYVDEVLDEDYSAYPHFEDPSEIYKEILDDQLGLVLDEDGSWKASSLRRFVVSLVSNSAIDEEEVEKKLLILQSFTSSYHFFTHLKNIMQLHKLKLPDEETKEKLDKWMSSVDYKGNTLSLMNKWRRLHGLFIGHRTIKAMEKFLKKIYSDPFYEQQVKFIKPALATFPQLRYGMTMSELPATDEPRIPNPQVIFKRGLTILEPDSLEVARQICLVFHKAFKAIHTREVEVALENQKVLPQTPTLIDFFSHGKRFEHLIVETIAMADNKEKAVQRVLEIAEKLLELGNYEATARILKALRKKELKKVQTLSSEKTMVRMKTMSDLSGVDPEFSSIYSAKLSERYVKWDTAIPNMKTEMVLLPKDASPSFIDGLINWKKRKPLGDKTYVLYRFQSRRYTFYPISQIQRIITRGPTMTRIQIEKCLV